MLKEPFGSSKRMQDVCDQIPSEFGDNDDYHRECYPQFTMNINRLRAIPNPSKEQKQTMHTRGTTEGKDKSSCNQVIYFANVMVKLDSNNKMYGHQET